MLQASRCGPSQKYQKKVLSKKLFITVDLDTLQDLYPERFSGTEGMETARRELGEGLRNLAETARSSGFRCTAFAVGRDYEDAECADLLSSFHRAGHEIASHSDSHPQGFRHLSRSAQAEELRKSAERIRGITGKRPAGFRAPGWNAPQDLAALLAEEGYLYDSSVFPTRLMPLMKAAYALTNRRAPRHARTTMGPLSLMNAPLHSYTASAENLGRPGESGVKEFPLTVTPRLRLPLTSTVHAVSGPGFFRSSLASIRRSGAKEILYSFHLADFVDYTAPFFQKKLPGGGFYVSPPMRLPLAAKMKLWKTVLQELTVWSDEAPALGDCL